MSQRSWLAYLNLMWLLYPQKLASLKATIQPLLDKKLPKNPPKNVFLILSHQLLARHCFHSCQTCKECDAQKRKKKTLIRKEIILMFIHLYQPSPVTTIIVSINAICIILLFIWSLYKFIPSCDRGLMLLIFPLLIIDLCLAKVNVINRHQHQYAICPKVIFLLGQTQRLDILTLRLD